MSLPVRVNGHMLFVRCILCQNDPFNIIIMETARNGYYRPLNKFWLLGWFTPPPASACWYVYYKFTVNMFYSNVNFLTNLLCTNLISRTKYWRFTPVVLSLSKSGNNILANSFILQITSTFNHCLYSFPSDILPTILDEIW